MALVEDPACQCRRYKRCRFDPWVRKIPWSRAWQPTPVFLPGESHGQGAWWATVHSIAKELDTTEARLDEAHLTHDHLNRG